jgi:NADPH:quinone reductase-like Zn-dependent oxidoreductase
MAANKKAHAVRLTSGFGIDKLTPGEIEVPEPKPDEVLIRVRAVSLNYRDLLVTLGKYNPKQHMPLILCSDGAGEVEAVGEKVTEFKPGDRVAGTFFQDWVSGEANRETGASALGGALDGMFTTYRVLSKNGVVHLPGHLSFEEGATLPCAALTAWQTLMEAAHIKAGDIVLLLGTGGVSIFGLQFALMNGARAIITSSSDEKLKRARELGASDTINYRSNPDWEKEVFALTNKRGVDAVVEVGGAGTFPKSLRSLRIGGHIGVIGNLSGIETSINLGYILQAHAHVHGIYVGSRKMFEDMNRAIALHKMQPVIDRVYDFTDYRSALEHMQRGEHFGKIVIRLT